MVAVQCLESALSFSKCVHVVRRLIVTVLVDTVPTYKKHGTYLLTQPGDTKMSETEPESGLQPGMWRVLVSRALLAAEHLSLTKKQGLEISF